MKFFPALFLLNTIFIWYFQKEIFKMKIIDIIYYKGVQFEVLVFNNFECAMLLWPSEITWLGK